MRFGRERGGSRVSGGVRPAAAFPHRHEGDGKMQSAQAFAPNATTFLTHLVGGGLADKRYVVERFRSYVAQPSMLRRRSM